MSTKLLSIELINYRRLVEGCGRRHVHITFPQEYNRILLMGENGIGKSSLMSQFNLLPPISSDGYEFIKGEIGEKTVIFECDDIKYKVTYICRPKGNTHTCSADLSKYENGKQIQIVQSSSVTEVVTAIKHITGIDNKLIKLSTLSVDDRGIVSMKSSERREFINSISPIGDVKDLIKTISEKYIYYKKTREASAMKLEALPSESSLYMSKQNLETEIKDLEEKKNSICDFKLMDNIEYESIKNNLHELKLELNDLNVAKSTILDNELKVPIDTHNSNIKSDISKLEGKRDILIKNISDATLEIKGYEMDKMVDIEEIKRELDNHEFHSIQGDYFETEEELRSVQLTYDMIQDNFDLLSQYDKGFSLEEKFIMNNIEETKSKYEKDLIALEFDISVLEKRRRDNFVPDNIFVEPAPECVITSCPLRKEFDTMVSKLEIFNATEKELSGQQFEKSVLVATIDRLEALLQYKSIFQNIVRYVSSNKLLSTISPIFKDASSFIEAMKTNRNYVFPDRLTELSYNTKVYLSFKNKQEILNKSNNSGFVSLKQRIDDWQNELSSLQEELKNEMSRIIKYNGRYGNLYSYEVEKKINDNLKDINRLEDIISVEEKKRAEFEVFKNDLSAIDLKIEEAKTNLDKVNFDIKLRDLYQANLEEAITGENDSLKIRETLSKHLPVRVMRRILLNLKDITNELLNVTDIPYRIYDFEITAKDFIIKVQKGSYINEDISKMSDGEKSIMSLTSMLALNIVMIPNYSVITLDEIDATLSAENKKKFLRVLAQFSKMKDSQIFAVSHNEYHSIDDKIGILEITPDDELKVLPFSK